MKWLWFLYLAGCTALGSEHRPIERASVVPVTASPAPTHGASTPRPGQELQVVSHSDLPPAGLLATEDGVAWIEGSEIRFRALGSGAPVVLATGGDLHTLAFDSTSLTFYWSSYDGVFAARVGDPPVRLPVPWTVVETVRASTHGVIAGVEEPTPGIWAWFRDRRPRLVRLARAAARISPRQLAWGKDAEVLFSLEPGGAVYSAPGADADAAQVPETDGSSAWVSCGALLVLSKAAALFTVSDRKSAPIRSAALPAVPVLLSCCGMDVCWSSQDGQVAMTSLTSGTTRVLATLQSEVGGLSAAGDRVFWARRDAGGTGFEIVSTELPAAEDKAD